MNKFLIGLIFGIAIAGGLAVYLNNAPTPFINKAATSASNTPASAPMVLAPGTKIQEATPTPDTKEAANASGGNSYDFYDVLQSKKASNANKDSNGASATVAASAPKPTKYMIQAGAFDSEELASDMKGRLALMGIDSTIQATSGGSNKVLIGPVNSEDKAQKIINQLSDQQINAVLVRISK